MKLGDRMKLYESASTHRLVDRLPVVIRLDGKAFHTYTADLSSNDPYFATAMETVAKALCASIMGAKLAYVQSDEISVLVNPWINLSSEAWFANNLIKIVSVSSGIASSVMTAESPSIFGKIKPACFDSRAFVLPPEEVNNYFIWRQQDAIRNSVQVLAQMNYSSKEIFGLNNSILKEKLKTEKGIDWDSQTTRFKMGSCIVRRAFDFKENETNFTRNIWVVDQEPPNFISNKSYIQEK